jgi:hypothetical protein
MFPLSRYRIILSGMSICNYFSLHFHQFHQASGCSVQNRTSVTFNIFVFNKKAVPNKFYEDALHIAIATINQVNVLASWNFKHIVNLDRIRMYNSVNLKNGLPMLEIRTPREILKFEDDEN